VVPPGDKINRSDFHLQNQARPLHSNAHVSKYSHQFAQFLAQVNIVIFYICPLLHFHQLPNTK